MYVFKLFVTANSGAAAGGVLFFITYIPYVFINPRYSTLSWWGKVACCLLNNVAMSMGARIISMYEGIGVYFF